MTSMTFTGTLVEKLRRTADSTSFRFSRPPEYDFEAGQHFAITVPSAEGPLKHVFSHADSPAEGLTELTTRMTGSAFKNALDALPIGGTAEFEGPAGKFLFRYQEPRIAFLVGGIGITPVRSMLRHLVDTGGEGRVDGQQLVLIYGCISEQGVVYREDLDECARVLPGLRVVHVMSDPSPDWKGHSGYITDDILVKELEDPSRWMLCVVGPPPMVAAMDTVANQLGLTRAQIVKESFAGYGS